MRYVSGHRLGDTMSKVIELGYEPFDDVGSTSTRPERPERGEPRDGLPTPEAPSLSGVGAALAGEAAVREARSAPDAASKARADRAMQRPPILRSSTKIQDSADRWLFVGFLLLGGIGTFVVKRMGLDAMYAAAAAVALMALYAGSALAFPKVRLRPDRLGDNCYYMGFIITLASMSAALIDLQAGAEVSTLIGNFGIALFSTIAGIGLRVVLQQMRTEVEDVEELVRKDLLDTAQKLRGQLVSAISDIESFRLGSHAAVEARLRESLDWHEKLSNERMALVEGAIAGMIERMEGAFAAQEQLLGHLRESGGETVAALRSVTKRLAAIKAPEDLIERKLDQTMLKIGGVLQTFEDAAASALDRQKTVAGATQGLRNVVSLLNEELSRVREQAEALGQATKPSQALADSLARMNGTVEQATAAIGKQQAAIEGAARLAQQAQRDLSDGLGSSQGTLRELEGAMARAGGQIAEGAIQLGKQLRGTAEAVASQRDVIRETASDAARARAEIASDLTASRSALSEVQRLLAETARAVSSALSQPQTAPTDG